MKVQGSSLWGNIWCKYHVALWSRTLRNCINDTAVAVKRLNEQFAQGLKEFLTEIQLLFGQEHPNLISLLGYCKEGNENIIVYEYAARGSLDRYIRRNNRDERSTTLTWDIKSSNILIDEKWVGRISDLGLSKLSVTGLEIAYRCLHDDREQRPSMDIVAKELEETLNVQVAHELEKKRMHEHEKIEDGYWEKKLPHHYQYLTKMSDIPLKYTTKKELYLLFRRGFLANNGPLVETFTFSPDHNNYAYYLVFKLKDDGHVLSDDGPIFKAEYWRDRNYIAIPIGMMVGWRPG
ncbi:serine-threonine/tyrosine-protein kinase catalytic domain-containing protein [Tanacetum coccineum]|uniref:Serine-threonine/tyrosine-protein kinase catalytic domain-containing protein n=1 Tax=Tanacetum coccineum TaxID=301880 RepID=A0ABQ5DL21_9ASTR